MKRPARRVRIRKGAIVGLDHGFVRWEDGGRVFSARAVAVGQWECTAPGYGIHGQGKRGYGDGALIVKDADLVDVAGPAKGVIWKRNSP